MVCKRCSKELEERTHSEITEKILKQPYYFSKWYVCRDCNFIQLVEKFKIKNNNYERK